MHIAIDLTLGTLLYKPTERSNFQELKIEFFEQVNKILDVYIVCTSPETGGKGLATAMIQRGLDQSSTEGYEAAQCMALSIYTQKICARLGFETVSR